MERTLRRMTMTTVMAVGILLMAATAAMAQYPPDQDFGVACTPQSPAPGDATSCSVVGAVPGETLTATAEFNPVFYEETLTANDAGEASFGFDVPAEADEDDEVIVTVTGEQSGTASTMVDVTEDEAIAEIVDPGEVAEDELAFTGGSLAMLGLVGFGLVGGGGLLLRKKRATTVG